MSSYIYFAAADEVDAVNEIAEANGYGPGNLSVPLVSATDSSTWYGCHSFTDLMQPVPELWSEQGYTVIIEYYPDGEPLDNWQDALAKNGLEQVQVQPL